MKECILVTGGAGFIGASLIPQCLEQDYRVVNLDLLTYAGSQERLNRVRYNPSYTFVRGDINDGELVRDILNRFHPIAIIHLAEESHVDRSSSDPSQVVHVNVSGTLRLLEESLLYWNQLTSNRKDCFRFVQASTYQVFGALSPAESGHTETSRYHPDSPFAATKAAADHLALSFFSTFGLPVVVSNLPRVYGPFQLPHFLIPMMILNGLDSKVIPVYGDGLITRDWLYVEDCCKGLLAAVSAAAPGETYVLGTGVGTTVLELAEMICELLDDIHPATKPHNSLIAFVADRPANVRHSVSSSTKAQLDLMWQKTISLDQGLRLTLEWYLQHADWVATKATIGQGPEENRLLTRYRGLVDQKYLGGLTRDEMNELSLLRAQIDDQNEGYYRRLISRLESSQEMRRE